MHYHLSTRDSAVKYHTIRSFVGGRIRRSPAHPARQEARPVGLDAMIESLVTQPRVRVLLPGGRVVLRPCSPWSTTPSLT